MTCICVNNPSNSKLASLFPELVSNLTTHPLLKLVPEILSLPPIIIELPRISILLIPILSPPLPIVFEYSNPLRSLEILKR